MELSYIPLAFIVFLNRKRNENPTDIFFLRNVSKNKVKRKNTKFLIKNTKIFTADYMFIYLKVKSWKYNGI